MRSLINISTGLALLLLPSICCCAQTSDSTLSTTPVATSHDTTSNAQENVIEVFKIKSHKTFRIDNTRSVWIECLNKKGKTEIRKAKIIDIGEHKIIFKPLNKKFGEVTYSDSDIPYIGFTSPTRVVIGSAAYVVAIAIAPLILYIAVMAYNPGAQKSGPKPNYSLAPGVRNIILKDYPNLKAKWGIRIVESN